MTYKAKIRIPTEQYAFVEIDMEGSPEDINSAYKEISSAMEVGNGLESKEWNKALDTYLETNKIHPDLYLRMDREQQNVIQEIKRSIKRIEYKNK